MYDSLEEITIDKLYIWISETTHVKKYLVGGNTIFHFSENGCSDQNEYDQKANRYCKGNEGVYFVELCNLWGYMVAWFMGAWWFLSFIHTLWKTWRWIKTEYRLGMRFITWCIVKLGCYVTLWSAFHILIVANDTSHMDIKVISCS